MKTHKYDYYGNTEEVEEQAMTVAELIEYLEGLDPSLEVGTTDDFGIRAVQLEQLEVHSGVLWI